MPDRIPEDLPDNMPEDMPERMPEDMPDRMPEDMSDRMPEDLPVRKCINVTVGITRSKVFFLNEHLESPGSLITTGSVATKLFLLHFTGHHVTRFPERG
jgi:hypothetical protein